MREAARGCRRCRRGGDVVRWTRGLYRCRSGSSGTDSRHRMSAHRSRQQNRSARGRRVRPRTSMRPERTKIFFLSAAHGNGVGELLEEIVSRLPAKEAKFSEQPDLRIALIGRPNVGKSSLLNRLSGFERSIVDSTPGTTRDAIDVRLDYKGSRLLLIDTAGIRRRPRVEGELEQASVGRAIEGVRRAEVLLLVIDCDRRHYRSGCAPRAPRRYQRSRDGVGLQ